MAIKGEKISAETRAVMSAAQKARWEKINEDREAARIHAAEPRCKVEENLNLYPGAVVRTYDDQTVVGIDPEWSPPKTRWQRFVAWFLGE